MGGPSSKEPIEGPYQEKRGRGEGEGEREDRGQLGYSQDR